MTLKEKNAILKDVRENQLPKWKAMTDRNAHGERIEATAKYFIDVMQLYGVGGEFAELYEVAKFINKRHKERGSLAWSLGEVRNAVDKQMMTLLDMKFGNKMVELVNEEGW